MATANCTYNGLANFNGGWTPTNGYDKTHDSYVGNGSGYGGVMQFVLPKAPGQQSGRTLTITLGLMTLYYSEITLEYWVTDAGRPNGVNYGSGPPAVKGNILIHGKSTLNGLSTSSWAQKKFTTPATSGLSEKGGTYYLWLRANRNAVVRANAAAMVLNYTATTACTAPTMFSALPDPFESRIALSWSGAASGVNNAIGAYELQYRTSRDAVSWRGWAALTTAKATEKGTTVSPAVSRADYVQFRIRAQGTAGSAYYSGWKESNVLRRNSAPTAPGSLQVSKITYSAGDALELTWSGAADTDGNIKQYRLQRRCMASGDWQAWVEDSVVQAAAGSGKKTVVPTAAANHEKLQYRIRTEDVLGAVSGYVESAVILRDDETGIHVFCNGALKKGYVYVCVNGKYHEGALYVCRSGAYVKGVD